MTKRSNTFRTILLIVAVFLLVTPPVSAWTVSQVKADPAGALIPGTPITVSLHIDFPDSGTDEQLKMTNIVLSTQFVTPEWNVTYAGENIVIANSKYEKPNVTVLEKGIGNWDSNPVLGSAKLESIHIILNGFAPTVTKTMNRTLISIKAVDGNNNPVYGTDFSLSRLIVNTCEIGCSGLTAVSNELEQLRAQIDNKNELGIDTSQAETSYNEAKNDIISARSIPSTRYLDALNYVNSAHNAIGNGMKALDKASVGKTIADAENQINKTNNIIGWFEGNESTLDDANLPPLIAGRDKAVNNLSLSQNQFASGNYGDALAQALAAFSEANVTYSEAVIAQEKAIQSLSNCNLCGNPFTPIVLPGISALIIVLAIVLIAYFYKKRKM